MPEPLSITASYKIIGFPDGNIISICPTIDLLVISMNKMSIWVFRLNGERIYAINNKSIIKDLCWSPDGKTFAVSGMDGNVKLYDTNNGDLIKQFEFYNPLFIACPPQEQQWKQLTPEIFEVDILSQLPKLNDFQDFDGIDYLVVTSETHISMIFNALVRFDIPTPYKAVNSGSVDLWNQVYITETNEWFKLNISKEDVTSHMIVILSKVKLILYNLEHGLQKLGTESDSFFMLFDRYLSNYYDNIAHTEESEPQDKATNIIISLQNTLLTQLIPSKLTDYWQNQFGERGFKRLLKQGNDTYDLIRNLLFKDNIQYLEKILVILNELKSLIEWNSINSVDLNINSDAIAHIIDRVQLQIKVYFQFIWDINQEQTFFNMFMNWTKYLMDSLARENNQEEPEVSDVNVSKLLKYISTMLVKSNINKYLNLQTYDILKFQTPNTDVIEEWTNLNTYVEQNVFKPFETYFISQVTISQPQPLNSPNCKIHIVNISSGKRMVVVSSTESHIKLIDLKDGIESTLEFQQLINYQVYNDKLIVVHKANEYCLEQYDIMSVFNNDLGSIKRVIDGKPNLLVVNPDRNYGYLFEENRMDYSMVVLG